jgi:hypothetical protein
MACLPPDFAARICRSQAAAFASRRMQFPALACAFHGVAMAEILPGELPKIAAVIYDPLTRYADFPTI